MLKERIEILEKNLKSVQEELNAENYYNLLTALDILRDNVEASIFLLLTDEEKIDRNKIV